MLGYNMFAYCNNNPVTLLDKKGKLLHPMDVRINDGMPSNNGPSSQKSLPVIPEEYGGNINTNIKNMVTGAKNNISNSNSIRKGLKSIEKGFTLIYTPAPTMIDEITGLIRIITGAYQIFEGFGKLIFGEVGD